MARMSAEEARDTRQWVVGHRHQITRRYVGGEDVKELSERYGVGAALLRRMLDRWLSGEAEDGEEE